MACVVDLNLNILASIENAQPLIMRKRKGAYDHDFEFSMMLGSCSIQSIVHGLSTPNAYPGNADMNGNGTLTIST